MSDKDPDQLSDSLLSEVFERIAAAPAVPENDPLVGFKAVQQRLTSFLLEYKFATDEVLTRITVLREEFEHTHDYSPIEHVRSRMKSVESLLRKAQRVGCAPTLDGIRENVRDIAGVRITCAFESDAYWIARILGEQPDITVVEVKDYIARPKPNGYQSLHLILSVPVYLSDRQADVYVELQIRTIAMDFWASLEHKLYYKYDKEIPQHIRDELAAAAAAAHALDRRMASLRDEVRDLGATHIPPSEHHRPPSPTITDTDAVMPLPRKPADPNTPGPFADPPRA